MAFNLHRYRIYVSGSAAYLTTLAVTVLIVYLMSPPVSNAIQGAFFVAAFFTGVIFGVLSLVFSDITEGFGCLLGGFCLSMWFLSLKDGGLIESATGRAIFIGCMSAGGYSLSFSHYTRNYGLIAAIAFSGATAAILGIDCLSGAGWKEFWLYLWNLNDNVFPLNTDTYPVTKNIRAELAGVVIIAVFGVVSQMRVWKMVKEHRAKSAAQQLERQQDQDREEEALGRKIEDDFQKERAQWEAAYGGKSVPESSVRSSTASPNASTSIREKEFYGNDSMEMISMSRSGVKRSMNGATPASTTFTISVLKDDDIQQVDAQGQPISYDNTEPAAEPNRTSLRSSVPPPPPTIVPLPFTIPHEEDAKTEEEDNTSVSAIPESGHAVDQTRRPMSKRISDLSAMRRRISRDVSESQEALISVPHAEDDLASSVAATLDDDHDLVSLHRLSPPDSPVGTEHGTSYDDPREVESEAHPTENVKSTAAHSATIRQSLTISTERPLDNAAYTRSPVRDSRIRADALVASTQGSSEGQQQGSQAEQAESQVGSLRNGVLPERLSRVALSYRTNEWAKHLEAADRPCPESLQVSTLPGVILEEVPEEAPALVSDEIAAPLLASKRNSNRTYIDGQVNGNSTLGLNRTGSTFSQESLTDQRSLARSPSVVSPDVLPRNNSGSRLDALSPLPSNTLMGQRESLIKNRVSSQSLTPQGSAANLLKEHGDQENMTLAQRRLVLQQQAAVPMLQHQTSGNSQRKASRSASQKWQQKDWAVKGAPPGFNSHQPKRTTSSQSDQKREQLYAGWRDNIRDVAPPQNAGYVAEQQRVALMKERKQKEMEKQHRESIQQQRASMMDSMMRSGHMLDAHREAMRKLQANANKGV